MYSQLPQFLWPIVRMICLPRKIVATAPNMRRWNENELAYERFHRTYVAQLHCKTGLYALTIYRVEGKGELGDERPERYTFPEVTQEIGKRYARARGDAMRNGFRQNGDSTFDQPTNPNVCAVPVLTFEHIELRLKWLFNLTLPKNVNQKSRLDKHPKSQLSAHTP